MSYIIITVLVVYLNGSIGKMKDYGISYLCSVYLWLWHLFMILLNYYFYELIILMPYLRL